MEGMTDCLYGEMYPKVGSTWLMLGEVGFNHINFPVCMGWKRGLRQAGSAQCN